METDQGETVLPPVNRLPPELLSAIFAERLLGALERSSIHDQTNQDSGPDAAIPETLRCSQVCHLWRDVALSTAFLWAFIRIKITRPVDDDRRCQFLDLWLKRSQGAPLRIWIACGLLNRRRYESDHGLQHLFGLVTAHAHHWQSLTLSIKPEWLGAFANLDENSAPLLQRFQVNEWGSSLDIGVYYLDNVRFYTGSPALQKLAIALAFRLDRIRLRSCHLTSLQLQWIDFGPRSTVKLSAFRDFFAQVRDTLIECGLFSLPNITWDDPSLSPVILTRVRRIAIEQLHGFDSLHQLLKIFTVPSLRDIDFRVDRFAQEDFIAMLHRSRCQLHRFAIGVRAVESVDTLACLREMPSLTVLNTDAHHLRSDAIEAMMPRSLPLLVPQLKELEFYTSGSTPEALRDLALMISARWSASKTLTEFDAVEDKGQINAIEKVHLSFEEREADKPGEEAMECLRQCIDEGLRMDCLFMGLG